MCLMKKNIGKLIRVVICLLLICGCKTQENKGLKTTFEKANLKVSSQRLLDIYLNSLTKLNPDDFALRLAIHEYEKNHYMVLLDNFHNNQEGYIRDYEEKWKVTNFKGFRTYVLDETEKVSKSTKEKIDIYYEMPHDSIIPDGYEGNMWEIHFRNDTLAEMHLMRILRAVVQDSEKRIREIDW